VAPSQLCGGRNRVLLLEANHHRAAQVRRAFNQTCPACHIEAVDRPADVVHRLEVQTYDAVILDLEPLGLEGLEFVREIANQGHEVPIVILSANRDEQIARAVPWPGAVLCLSGSNADLDSLPRYLADVLGSECLTQEQGRPHEEMLSREKSLDTLHSFVDMVSGASEPDQILQCAVEVARSAIPNVETSMGQLIDERAGHLVVRAPEDAGSDSESSLPLASTSVTYEREARPFFELGPGIRSCLDAPLVMQGKVTGRLSVGSAQADAFDETHQRVLTTLASYAAMAIQNADLRRQIQSARERYQAVVESASDAICLVDLENWRFLEANSQAGDLTGYGLEALRSLSADDVCCLQEGSQEKVTLRNLLASGGSNFENLSLVRNDGRLLPVSVRVNTLTCGQVRSAQVVLRDVSARKEMEERLVQAEKLAALERLAGSLAHEINNPLQALRTSINLLSKGPLDEAKRLRYAGIADQEVERLTRLVQRMLDFSRAYGDERAWVNVNDLLEDTLALAGKQLEHCGIAVVKEFAESLPPVGAASSYLRQVFINLVLYHVEAMPKGGRLVVRTSVDQVGHQLVITFRDTGRGIPADEMPYIFEPFYSTREGSDGLGLAVSYSIVKKHGGVMEVSSEEGVGTLFSIRLPLGDGVVV
jgi:two-component system NtrC family sensor kinase